MIGTVITFAFVLGTLTVAAYALFKMSPFAHHKDYFRDPGERQQSPHLD
jgi:hypothetical protein